MKPRARRAVHFPAEEGSVDSVIDVDDAPDDALGNPDMGEVVASVATLLVSIPALGEARKRRDVGRAAASANRRAR